ncbi:MAG: hypothetical protein KGI33_08025 [Thaumarchaeota archaeon]|nr:hypothetical protein [Nitrososphaerota archaeon]
MYEGWNDHENSERLIQLVLVTICATSSLFLIFGWMTPTNTQNTDLARAYALTQPVTCSISNGGPSIAVGYVGGSNPLTVDLGVGFGQTSITSINATANFGDGSTTVESTSKTNLGAIQIEHTYQNSGNYTISIILYGSEYIQDNIPNIVNTQAICQVSVLEPVTPANIGPPSITLRTDKTSYNYGDPIIVSGNVTNAIPTTTNGPVTNLFITISGQGSTNQIGPITINPNGSFSQVIQPTSFVSGSGSYTVTAQYGGYTSPSTTFYYPPSTVQQTTPTTPTTSPATLITITTDKTSYNYGDPVTVSGKVTNTIPSTNGGPAIQLYITINTVGSNSQGLIGPIQINSDGNFAQVVHPTSFISDTSDYYVVTAQYGYGGFVNGKISSGQTFSGPTFYYPSSNNQSTPPTVQQTTSPLSSTSSGTGITVETDKPSYIKQDPITISGTVSTYVPNVPVTVIVRNPAGQAVTVTQAQVGSNGVFSTIVTPTTSNGLWQSGGTYSVLAQYNGQVATTAQTSFQFSGFTGQVAVPLPVISQGNAQQQTIPSAPTTALHRQNSSQQTPQDIQQTSSPTISVQQNSSVKQTTSSNQMHLPQNITQTNNNQTSTPQPQVVLPEPSNVPNWVKNIYLWYKEGKISNKDFVSGIQFLIDSGIIHLKQ